MSRLIAPLSAIEGQPAAVATLQALARREGPVPPLLLHGPDGVGKRSAALAFAGALVCRGPDGTDACGRCAGCARVADAPAVTELREGASGADAPRTYPDVGLIGIPSGKTRLSVLQARDIALSMSVRPFELSRRIYIVDPADALTVGAANALLKVLEEPPPFGVLVLVTASPAALPVTVRSRLTAVRFRPLPADVIERLLLARGTAAEEAAARAARARGSVARALALDPEAEAARIEAWTRVLGLLAERGPAGAAGAAVLAGESLAGSADEAGAALDLLLALLGEIVAAREGAAPSLLAPDAAARLAPAAGRLLGPALDRALLVEQLRREIVLINRNPRLAVEGAVLALAGLLPRGPLVDMVVGTRDR
ncbi:MAG: hypothetical protein KBD01_10375 [Acidobacteria bacterium]|nr:hypothetical protein [Acidobacteriota bacterium]